MSGAVQKGPFVIGSTLDVVLLDQAGEPTGDVFPTTISNDLGEFEIGFSHSGPIGLSGVGFHYNEVTGQVSDAPITLRALHSITMAGPQQAHVNVVTHLAEPRARDLLSTTDLATATAQAEQELVAALGIGPAAFDPATPGIAMNLLGGNTTANAYLFAVSAVMAQAAVTEAGVSGSVDGELQELLNTTAIDLADGTLEPARRQIIADAETAVVPDRVVALLADRLAELGSSASPPDLDLVLDTDHDDVVNAADSCPWVANPTQMAVPTEVCHAQAAILADGPTAVDRVELLHLDSDAALDAVARSVDSYTFLAGDGTGGLTAMQTVLIPSATQRVHFADLNDDGVVDIVAEATQGQLAVYLRTAGFGPLPTPQSSMSASIGNLQPTHGRLDGDAFPELLLMAGFFTNGNAEVALPFTLLHNDGLGGFSDLAATGTVPAGTSFQGPMASAILDVTNDQAGDLVVAGTSADGSQAVVLTFPGDGSGSLGATVVSTAALPPASDMQLGELAISEVTGDGVVDVVALGRGSQVVTLPGNGDGTFGPAFTSEVALAVDGMVGMGQLTADGLPDLLVRVASAGDLGVAVLPNLGGGTFGSATTRVTRLLGPTAQGVTAGAVGPLAATGLDDFLFSVGPLAIMRFGP
ncbi:MAG: VCBS repeat-containing protein [Polyangiaceae bacterium]